MSAEETPVIIGIGEVKNPSKSPEDAIEPLHLMLQAIRQAIDECQLSSSSSSSLTDKIESISVVRTWTWPYSDLPGLLAHHLGANPRHKYYSDHGGHNPAMLLDEAARRVAQGGCKVAIVTGGEAMASVIACVNAKMMPPPGWTVPPEGEKTLFSPTSRGLPDDPGGHHSIGAPIHVYPLYENGFRAHRQQSLKENHQESAELYAQFARIATSHPAAWNHGKSPESARSIADINERNRMICFPYPLLMNAFNNVNLAAACIVTSVSFAKSLGVQEDRWIYPLGGAGTRDSDKFWQRPNYHSSPSISRSLDAALDVCDLRKEDIDLFDFYSCFPIVPKLACAHLNLSITDPARPITLLGGLTSFGGAGNNYSMHAIAETVRQLRQLRTQRTQAHSQAHPQARKKPTNALILANGGVLTHQHVIILSTHRSHSNNAYLARNPLPAVLDDEAIPDIEYTPHGKAIIETYTVEFSRGNTPLRGHIIGRMKGSGKRFLANHADEKTLRQLVNWEGECIGRGGWVRSAGEGKGRNVFIFDDEEEESKAAKL